MGAGKPEESIPTELVQPGTISEAGPPSPPSQDGENASLAGAPYHQSGHRDGAGEHGPLRSHQLSKK